MKQKKIPAIKEKTEQENSSSETNILKITLSVNFIGIFMLLSYISCIPIFFNMNLKVLGLNYFSDSQINKLGFIQSLCLVSARLIFGWMIDKRGIQNVIMYLLIASGLAYFVSLH